MTWQMFENAFVAAVSIVIAGLCKIWGRYQAKEEIIKWIGL
jgi:hypothetical protein